MSPVLGDGGGGGGGVGKNWNRNTTSSGQHKTTCLPRWGRRDTVSGFRSGVANVNVLVMPFRSQAYRNDTLPGAGRMVHGPETRNRTKSSRTSRVRSWRRKCESKWNEKLTHCHTPIPRRQRTSSSNQRFLFTSVNFDHTPVKMCFSVVISVTTDNLNRVYLGPGNSFFFAGHENMHTIIGFLVMAEINVLAALWPVWRRDARNSWEKTHTHVFKH